MTNKIFLQPRLILGSDLTTGKIRYKEIAVQRFTDKGIKALGVEIKPDKQGYVSDQIFNLVYWPLEHPDKIIDKKL